MKVYLNNKGHQKLNDNRILLKAILSMSISIWKKKGSKFWR
jgi:hypothetical protein